VRILRRPPGAVKYPPRALSGRGIHLRRDVRSCALRAPAARAKITCGLDWAIMRMCEYRRAVVACGQLGVIGSGKVAMLVGVDRARVARRRFRVLGRARRGMRAVVCGAIGTPRRRLLSSLRLVTVAAKGSPFVRTMLRSHGLRSLGRARAKPE
jgi:hypothetical protein